MAKHKTQQSLSNWTREEWGTKSGKNSTQGSKATGNGTYLKKHALLYQIKSTLALLLKNVHQCVKVSSTVGSQMMWLKKLHVIGADYKDYADYAKYYKLQK